MAITKFYWLVQNLNKIAIKSPKICLALLAATDLSSTASIKYFFDVKTTKKIRKKDFRESPAIAHSWYSDVHLFLKLPFKLPIKHVSAATRGTFFRAE